VVSPIVLGLQGHPVRLRLIRAELGNCFSGNRGLE
jgi:hypothetical protein